MHQLRYLTNMKKRKPKSNNGTTMIEWSLEKATMIDRSRMHFACYNFEN